MPVLTVETGRMGLAFMSSLNKTIGQLLKYLEKLHFLLPYHHRVVTQEYGPSRGRHLSTFVSLLSLGRRESHQRVIVVLVVVVLVCEPDRGNAAGAVAAVGAFGPGDNADRAPGRPNGRCHWPRRVPRVVVETGRVHKRGAAQQNLALIVYGFRNSDKLTANVVSKSLPILLNFKLVFDSVFINVSCRSCGDGEGVGGAGVGE
jgi:hypothetical protein